MSFLQLSPPHQIIEKCREAELSPRRRASPLYWTGSSGSGGGNSSSSPTPPDLQPAVQRLRATGRIAEESLRLLLGPEDGAYLEVALQAFERAELGVRLTGAYCTVICLFFCCLSCME